MMDSTIKAAWLAALRSGQYRQGQHSLRSGTGSVCTPLRYCCLGVLCAIHSRRTGIAWGHTIGGQCGYNPNEGQLPPAVAAWAGLDVCDPRVSIEGFNDPLSSWNDGAYSSAVGVVREAKTFAQIADAIERQL